MADYEVKSNTLSMFINEKAKENPSQPTLRGKMVVNIHELGLEADELGNVHMDFALWSKVGKDKGTKYWAGTISKPYVKDQDAGFVAPPHGGDATPEPESGYSVENPDPNSGLPF